MIDQSEKGRFEDRLLTELKQVVATRAMEHGGGAKAPHPAPERRPAMRRRLALAGAFGAVGVAVSVAFAVAPGGSTPAYAVRVSPDGTVTVTANYLGDPAEANEELRRAGVRAVVLPAVPAESCPAADRGRKVPAEDGGQGDTILVTQMGGPERVEVRWMPESTPPGTLLVLSPQLNDATGEMVMTIDHYYQPGPDCVAKGTAGLVPVPRESINSYEPNPPVATESPVVTPGSPGAVPGSPGVATESSVVTPRSPGATPGSLRDYLTSRPPRSG